MAYRNYSTSVSHIVSLTGLGDFSSINAAILAASFGDTVFISNGSYSEDVILKDGVNLASISGNYNKVIVTGKVSISLGVCHVSNITLNTNGDYALDVNGTGSVTLNVFSCSLTGADNNIINATNSNSTVNFYECHIAAASPFHGFDISNGFVSMYGGTLFSTIGRNSITGGQFQSFHSNFQTGWDLTLTAFITILHCQWDANIPNSSCIDISGASRAIVGHSSLSSGTASSIVIVSGSQAELFNNNIDSFNVNALTGSGTLIYGGNIFENSNGVNVSTIIGLPLNVEQGGTGDVSFVPFGVVCGGTTPTNPLQSVIDVGIAGQVLTSNGPALLPSFQNGGGGGSGSIVVQTFTSSGTYTPSTGMTFCFIEVSGGGAGGGGANALGVPTNSCPSGGGGGGEYAKGLFSSGTIGVSKAVTIGGFGTGGAPGVTGGNGGNTSVGALISAFGGLGGTGTTGNPDGALGGMGGTGGTGGFIQIHGEDGFSGVGISCMRAPAGTQITTFGGDGANSFYGSGGQGFIGTTPSDISGDPAQGFGAGGGGAESTGGTGASGGNGTAGLVIITEFIGLGGGGGGGLTWLDASGIFTTSPNTGYFITANATATLSASPTQGNVVAFAVDTNLGLTITANTGQTIRLGTTISSVGGTCSNTQHGDSIELIYRAVDTTWIATSSVGMWGLA